MENGLQTFPRLLIVKETDQPFFTRSPSSVSNRGVINIGDGVFDNITPGFFTGSTNGTALAVNVASGFAGNLADLQVNGVSKFKISNAGTMTLAGVIAPGVSDAMTYANPMTVNVTLAEIHTTTTTSGVGNATMNASSGGTAGQRMTIVINNDAGAARTITFATNFKTTNTLVGTASKACSISFISDGTSWWETGRAGAAVTTTGM